MRLYNNNTNYSIIQSYSYFFMYRQYIFIYLFFNGRDKLEPLRLRFMWIVKLIGLFNLNSFLLFKIESSSKFLHREVTYVTAFECP